MVNFEKPANQSDAEKIYRNSISQQYYNIFVDSRGIASDEVPKFCRIVI